MAIERDPIDLTNIRTIGDIATPGGDRAPDKIALITDAGAFTFAEMDRLANRFAHAVLASGAARRDSAADILIMCANGHEYVAAHFGAARTGAVLAHLSSRASADDLAYALELSGAKLLITDDERYPTFEAASAKLDAPPRVIGLGGEFEDFLGAGAETRPKIEIDPAQPFSILFTGGTTGRPKGAIASHRARIASSAAAAEDHPLHASDVAAVTTPLSHAAGLFTWFQPAYLAGATAVLKQHWDAGEFIETVGKHGVSGAFVVPVQLAMLLDHPDCAPERLKSLRAIIAGGAEAPPALHRRMVEMLPDIDLVIAYGSTETGHVISQQPSERAEKPGSLGRVGQHYEVKVFKGPGEEAPPGEAGEIATLGPHLLEGYLGNEEETRAYFKSSDGWGWTGDLGFMDEDGVLTLAGRAKEIIISGGINIYPAEVETVLLEHPAVADCAAFGIADDKWGELPAAAVILRDRATAREEDLIEYAAQSLARFKRPRKIIFVQELPRTAGGKIQRARLKNLPGA